MKKSLLITAVLLLASSIATAATVEVKMKDYGYEPETVTIHTGDTVTWVNTVETPHTTTSGKDGAQDGRWESKRLNNGESFSYTFNEPGTYDYFCIPHNLFGMKGVVEVK